MKQSRRIAWSAWGDTDPGNQRENNEDCIYCDEEHGIFIVVDGMGGEAAGEVAAHHAMACIRGRLEHETGTLSRRIREAITSANNEVYRLGQQNAAWRGMACVLTVAVLEDGKLHIGHVGDTRLYMIRDGSIRKITPDHSPVGVREDAGTLTEAEAMRHPRRNEVFRDVGSELHRPEDPDFIDYIQAPFEPDSAMLLCSDGLTDMLSSTEILRIVQANARDPRKVVSQLIERANAAGGRDNISAITVIGENFPMSQSGKTAGARHAEISSSNESRTGFGMAPIWRGAALLILGMIAGMILLGFLYSRRQPQNAKETSPPISERRILQVGGPEFPTIQSALNAAQPGDHVDVPAGEYHETVQLRDGVSVGAHVPGKAIIDVPQPLRPDEAVVLADKVQHAAFSGFVIRARPAAALAIGIRITNADVRMADVEVSGTTKAALWVDGDSNPVLTGLYIHGNAGAGVVIAGTSSPRLIGNMIQNNGTARGHAAPGIQVIDEAKPQILRNVISANGAQGIRIRRPELTTGFAENFFPNGAAANKAGAIGMEK